MWNQRVSEMANDLSTPKSEQAYENIKVETLVKDIQTVSLSLSDLYVLALLTSSLLHHEQN